MGTWVGKETPDWPSTTVMGMIRGVARGLPAILTLIIGLMILLIFRVFERPIWGLHRPITPWITVYVCRTVLFCLGLRVRRKGDPMPHHGAFVANHVSWMDIFVLNSGKPLYFVSKSEVSGWVGIGWLARATGTLFIKRNRQEAKQHLLDLETRLAVGHRLLFFPEGTSTDGLRVLSFKTTLYDSFLNNDTALHVQPLSMSYNAPYGARDDFWGWWGDMGFGAHLWMILTRKGGATVDVTYHKPLKAKDFPDRKALARASEHAVRAGMPAVRQIRS